MIRKWQDNNRVEITDVQLNSADFTYNDDSKDDNYE